MRYPNQVVNRHPLIYRVLPTGSGAVCDGRLLCDSPKAVAVIHKRFRPGLERFASNGCVGLLKRNHKSIVGIERKSVTNESELDIGRGPRLLCQLKEQGAKLAFDFSTRRGWQPPACPLQPALVGILVVNLAAMNLADED